MKTQFQIILLLVVTSFLTNVLAQEVSIPDPGLNAAIRETLSKPAGSLTVQDLLTLTNLNAMQRSVSSLEGLSAAQNLTTLDLRGNQLTGDLDLPLGLTNLTWLNLCFNRLTNFALPADLTSLTFFGACENQLTSFTVPAGLTTLTILELGGNQLTNLTLPEGLTSLVDVDLGTALLVGYDCCNRLTDLSFLNGLTNLSYLNLDGNQLTNFTLPAGLTSVETLSLAYNHLTSLVLPAGLTNLTGLNLNGNQLTDFSFLSGLTGLMGLYLQGNQLTNLTLPPGLTSLTYLYIDNTPLRTFVLSEPLAVTGLAPEVASLRNQGVSVYTYPLAVSLVSGKGTMAGAFEFTLTGPPGIYTVLSSANLAAWSELGTLTNNLATAIFTDAEATNSSQKFYRAQMP